METRNAADISFNSLQVRSNEQHLKNEIKHLKKVFRDINGQLRPNQITTNTEENEHLLMLLYKGKSGEKTKVLTEHFKICNTTK